MSRSSGATPTSSLAPIHELVTYELHPATFAGAPDDPGELGELGDRRQLHTIHTDVVYNHRGPSDLDLWRFDGFRLDSTVNIRNAKGEDGEIASDSYGSATLTYS